MTVAGYQDIVDAEAEALVEFGADKLELEAAIIAEFDRYTGALNIVDEDVVLYADIFAAAVAAKIDEKFADLFVAEVGAELDVAEIVFSADLEDKIEAIEKAYAAVYKKYPKDADASLKEAFEIAFIGAEYILSTEGNYLQVKLAEAKARAAELVAAYDEYKATLQTRSTTKGLNVLVNEYLAGGFIFTDKKIASIDSYADLLAAWMTKYGFDSEDANLVAILGENVYNNFMVMKAIKGIFVEWNTKLTAISADDIEDAIELVAQTDALFDYAEQSAAVKALDVWFNGAKEDGSDSVFAAAKLTKKNNPYTNVDVALSEANIVYMLTEHFGITAADKAAATAIVTPLVNALVAFEKENGILDDVKAIEKAVKELDPAAVTVSEYLAAIADIKADIAALCATLGLESDAEADYGYAVDSKNYGIVPFEVIDTLDKAQEALVGDLLAEAAKIVKAYIGWKGVAVEDEAGLKFNGKFYDVEKFVINVYSYKDVAALETIYKAISVFDFDGSFVIEDVEGEEVAYTTANVVSYFEQIRQQFYNVVMNGLNSSIKNETEVGAITTYYNTLDAGNDWMAYGATADETLTALETTYGDKGPKFVYPTSSSDKGTKSNEINVYKSTTLYLTDSMGAVVPVSSTDSTPKATYSYVEAIKAVAKDADKYATYETKDGVKKLTSFDVAGFKAAVDAKVAEYRTLWYTEYLKLESTKADLVSIYTSIITTAIKYELWTIEGAFEMDDEAYTFVVNADRSVTVLDADKEAVAKVKDAEGVEYAITAAFDANGALVIKANNKLLSDVDDAEKTEYVYALADGVAAINEANAKIGAVPQLLNTSTYRRYKTENFSKLFEAYSLNEFYLGYAALLTKASDAVTAQKAIANSAGDTMINNLYTIFKLEWNNLTPTTTTLDKVDAAVTAFINQITKIAAENK